MTRVCVVTPQHMTSSLKYLFTVTIFNTIQYDPYIDLRAMLKIIYFKSMHFRMLCTLCRFSSFYLPRSQCIKDFQNMTKIFIQPLTSEAIDLFCYSVKSYI